MACGALLILAGVSVRSAVCGPGGFSRPRALSTPFSRRLALLRLCAMTLILPVLVAVFGILSVYGRQGWLASLWQMLGLQWTFSPTACRAFYWRTSF